MIKSNSSLFCLHCLLFLGMFFIIGHVRAQDVVDLKEQYDRGIAYYNAGNYEAAIKDLEEVLPEVEKVYTDTASYYNLLNTLGDAYSQQEKHHQSKYYFHKVWKAYSKTKETKYLEYGLFSAVALGNIYQLSNRNDSVFYFYQQSIKEWDRAKAVWDDTYLELYNNMVVAGLQVLNDKQEDSLYVNYLKRIAKVKTKKSVVYARTEVTLADRYTKREAFDLAMPMYREGLKLLKDSALTTDFLYCEGRYNEGRIWMKKIKYLEADSCFQDAYSGTLHQPEHVRLHSYAGLQLGYIARHYRQYDKALSYLLPLVALTSTDDDYKLNLYTALAGLYVDKGEWILAEDYYMKALALTKANTTPKTRLQLQFGLINLYENEGKTERSAPLLNEATALTLTNFGEQSEEYAHLLALNAAQQKMLGQWTVAEVSYKKAISILEVKAKDRADEWIFLYNNLAEVYQLLGREQDAEIYYNKAASMAASTWGSNSIDYAYMLTNLAGILEKKGKYDEALINYNKALVLFEKNIGKSNIDYLSVMNNIAFVYIKKGLLTEAETRLTSLLPQAEKTLGKESALVTTMLNNLGLIREKQERYKDASDIYSTSLKRRIALLGTQHPLVTDVYCNLARSSAAQKNFVSADSCWIHALNNFNVEINLYFPVMSEKEKSAFYYTIQDRFEQFNSYAVEHIKRSPALLEYIFKYQTLTKSLLFRSNRKLQELLQKNTDPLIKQSWSDWEKKREELATLYAQGKLTPDAQDRLEKEIEALEIHLSKAVNTANAMFKMDTYQWKDVQAKLSDDEVWVEVVRFRKYKSEKGGTYVKYKYEDDIERDSVYFAFIIITKKEQEPQLVLLKSGTALENKYIKYYYNAITFKLNDEYTYDQFWKPVHQKIKVYKKVYLSSDGVYHLLNVATIKDENGKYMLDSYDIYSYTGASDLIDPSEFDANNKNVRLVGSPEFSEVKIGSAVSLPMSLPGTLQEVQLVSDLFKNTGWNVTLSSGFNATENAVKDMTPPYVLHIATHGYFLEDIEASKETSTQSENPLMRSGLILAKNKDLSDIFSDGVLTAYESMNLPLAKTRLVVLSACQTGQGKVKNGEGVYGLERALRSSGAVSIVLSLWKVDDKVTQELMVQFYRIWLTGIEKDMKQAFFKAQRQLKEKYPEPYYWGAFTWVGN